MGAAAFVCTDLYDTRNTWDGCTIDQNARELDKRSAAQAILHRESIHSIF